MEPNQPEQTPGEGAPHPPTAPTTPGTSHAPEPGASARLPGTHAKPANPGKPRDPGEPGASAGEGTLPVEADVPVEETAPGGETAPGEETVPAGATVPVAAAAGAPPSPEMTELARLRAEIAELREQLLAATAGAGAGAWGGAGGGAAPPPRRRSEFWLGFRRFLAAFLVALTGFGAVASVIGVWADRTTFNTGRWVATVGPLPEKPEISTAMAAYLTDEVFTTLNVQQRLKQALPPDAAFLAGPVTNAVRDYVRTSVSKFMQTEQFQRLWESANRFAHDEIVAVLEGRSKTVTIQGNTVVLNLLPVVNDLLLTLEQELPTLFGKKLQLPTLTSGEIPPGLRQQIETSLGVKLPADFAQIKLFKSNELSTLQHAIVIFKRSLTALIIGTVLAFLCALLVAPNRRRTILQFGLWLVIATVALTAVIRVVQNELLSRIPQADYRDAARVATDEIFTSLRNWGYLLLILGILIMLIAYLTGPSRTAIAVRRNVARWIRTGGSYTASTTRSIARSGSLRTFVATYADALRIGGALLAVLIALLLSSWAGLIVVAVVLAAYEVIVTLIARSAGPAGPGGPGGPGDPRGPGGASGGPGGAGLAAGAGGAGRPVGAAPA